MPEVQEQKWQRPEQAAYGDVWTCRATDPDPEQREHLRRLVGVPFIITEV